MSEYKKNYKPQGGRGTFSRPSFGGGNRRPAGRDFNSSVELYKTSCSKCNASCEVPFKPNGKKPIFCKNCFVRDDTSFERPSRDSYEKRSYNDKPRYQEERSFAPKRETPVEDPRIGAMQRELTVIHDKLDTLIQSLEAAKYSAILTGSNERVEKEPVKKAAAKSATKKVAKKTTKKA